MNTYNNEMFLRYIDQAGSKTKETINILVSREMNLESRRIKDYIPRLIFNSYGKPILCCDGGYLYWYNAK